MSYSNPKDLEPSSPEIEEGLPVYEEENTPFMGTSSTTDPTSTPDAKASPDEVRDFLVAVMQSRGISLDHARRVAARWTLGTGHELRSYPVAMYRDIFGPEDGWVVYKEVRVRFYTAEKQKRRFGGRNTYLVLMAICTALFIASIAILASNASIEVVEVVGPLMALWVLGIMMFAIAAFVPPWDPEKKAEQELQREWYKSPTSQARRD